MVRDINRVEWRTEPPLAVGSRIAFVAAFLGRRLEYTYEVCQYSPREPFVVSTSEGPFPMETTYIWEDTPGGTAMMLRNRGEPAGFAKVAAPMMTRAMARANRKDLELLKAILERQPEHPGGSRPREARSSNSQGGLGASKISLFRPRFAPRRSE